MGCTRTGTEMGRLALSALCLLLSGPLFARQPGLEIAGGGRRFFLPRAGVVETWPRLTQQEQRRAATAVLEWAMDGPAPRAEFIALLLKSEDSVTRAFGRAGSAVLLKQPLVLKGSEEHIASFLGAVLDLRRGRKPASGALLALCRVPGQQVLCDLARFAAAVDTAHQSPKIDTERLRDLLRWGVPFLSKEPLRPAFAPDLAGHVPEHLFALGLPLEAALLADRLAEGENNALRRQVSYYLTAAGDFQAARSYSSVYPHQSRAMQLNAELDWLTLSGNYRGAIRLILKESPDHFAPQSMTRHADYWTEFRMRPEVVRLRLALLLFLAGDKRKAVTALEGLREFSGTAYRGEPEKHLARLRLAQIVLKENPELAQKIAEDITYLAQEKDWRILEYQATLLDGWANYYLKNNYRALICFTKAGGILQGENRQYATQYSHLMGTLAVRIAMRPKGNHSGLIARINALLGQRPYNEAVFTIREWTPLGNGPDFFLEQATKNLDARGDPWASVNLLLEFSRAEDHFFAPGRNPGGLRGFAMSVQWSRELARIPYFSAWLDAPPALRPSAVAHAGESLPSVGSRVLTAANMKSRGPYVFTFPIGSDRLVYLVYPNTYTATSYRTVRRGKKRRRVAVRTRVATASIEKIRLSGPVVAGVRKDCSIARTVGCETYATHFASLAARASGGHGILHVQYDPEFDLDFSRLLRLKNGTGTVFFYGQDAARARPGTPSAVQYAQGCPTDLTRDMSASPGDFPVLFSTGADKAGIWLWPVGLDDGVTAGGRNRPVYLRNFVCGERSLRFWEMDRFSGGTPPSLVLFRRRAGEPALDRAFARHFAERGTILVEMEPTAASVVRRIFGSLGKSLTAESLMSSYRKQGAPGSVRIILPHVLDG